MTTTTHDKDVDHVKECLKVSIVLRFTRLSPFDYYSPSPIMIVKFIKSILKMVNNALLLPLLSVVVLGLVMMKKWVLMMRVFVFFVLVNS